MSSSSPNSIIWPVGSCGCELAVPVPLEPMRLPPAELPGLRDDFPVLDERKLETLGGRGDICPLSSLRYIPSEDANFLVATTKDYEVKLNKIK